MWVPPAWDVTSAAWATGSRAAADEPQPPADSATAAAAATGTSAVRSRRRILVTHRRAQDEPLATAALLGSRCAVILGRFDFSTGPVLEQPPDDRRTRVLDDHARTGPVWALAGPGGQEDR